MSIIYDALKKVQTSQPGDSETKIDKGTKSKPKVYLLYALMVCLGLFVANIFYKWLIPKPLLDTTQKESLPNYSQPSTGITAPETGASLETKIETQKQSPPAFTLNGVFSSGEEGYALINNRVVKKGDKIEGATVVQISLDEVDLEFGGSIIKLSYSTH